MRGFGGCGFPLKKNPGGLAIRHVLRIFEISACISTRYVCYCKYFPFLLSVYLFCMCCLCILGGMVGVYVSKIKKFKIYNWCILGDNTTKD